MPSGDCLVHRSLFDHSPGNTSSAGTTRVVFHRTAGDQTTSTAVRLTAAAVAAGTGPDADSNIDYYYNIGNSDAWRSIEPIDPGN